MVKKSIISKYSYLKFFKVASVYIEDSLAHYWNKLNQLHKLVTWNA